MKYVTIPVVETSCYSWTPATSLYVSLKFACKKNTPEKDCSVSIKAKPKHCNVKQIYMKHVAQTSTEETSHLPHRNPWNKQKSHLSPSFQVWLECFDLLIRLFFNGKITPDWRIPSTDFFSRWTNVDNIHIVNRNMQVCRTFCSNLGLDENGNGVTVTFYTTSWLHYFIDGSDSTCQTLSDKAFCSSGFINHEQILWIRLMEHVKDYD